MEQQRRLYFGIAFSTFVILGISGGLLNIAWIYMQDTFAVQLDALGILLLFSTIGSLIAAFGSGTVIRRFGLGRVLLMGVLLDIAGLIGYAISPAWAILLIITFLLYMGRGTLDAGINNFVSANYGSSEMNWLHAGWGLGLTIAPAVITPILNLGYGWQLSYILSAGVMIFVAIIFAVTLPHWNLRKQKRSETDPELVDVETASMWETVRHPLVRWIILLFLAYGGLEIGTGQLANTLLVEGRGLTQETSSLWIGIYWGSFTFGRMIVGVVAMYVSDRRILQGCFSLAVIGAALLTLSAYQSVYLFGLALIGFGLSAIFPILIARTPDMVGIYHAPNVIGFQVGFAGFGAAVLPGITGFFAQRFGLEAISQGIFITALLVVALYFWLTRVQARLQPVS